MSRQRKHKAKRPHRRRWKKSSVITWVTLGGLAAAIVVLGFFAFVGGGEAQPKRPARQEPVVTDERQFTINVRDNWFEPDELTVRQGTEITWKFKGNAEHDVTQYEGEFESGTLGSGDEYVLTFDEPGTYEYYCTLHHSMNGKITVQPN